MLGCLGYEGYVTFTDLAVKPLYGEYSEIPRYYYHIGCEIQGGGVGVSSFRPRNVFNACPKPSLLQ